MVWLFPVHIDIFLSLWYWLFFFWKLSCNFIFMNSYFSKNDFGFLWIKFQLNNCSTVFLSYASSFSMMFNITPLSLVGLLLLRWNFDYYFEFFHSIVYLFGLDRHIFRYMFNKLFRHVVSFNILFHDSEHYVVDSYSRLVLFVYSIICSSQRDGKICLILLAFKIWANPDYSSPKTWK